LQRLDLQVGKRWMSGISTKIRIYKLIQRPEDA
jgi:hypothetical protein